MPTTPKFPIDLKPTPGFCIKSTVVNLATISPPARSEQDNVLEPTAPVVIPAGRKVFINVCYDKNVPPPPPADEEAIKRAMNVQEPSEDIYYVPVVVSQPRQDKDKAGHPSLVFDCVFNSTVRSRALRDSDFKVFLVELALQRIETQTSLFLSRQIGTPNITAKGKLEPRRVWVPTWLATGQDASLDGEGQREVKVAKTLIEVVEPSRNRKKTDESTSSTLPKLKGILKKSSTNVTGGGTQTGDVATRLRGSSQRPIWRWRKESGEGLTVIVDVQEETPYETIAEAELDVEPRRLILRVPGSAKSSPLELDLDLNKSDAEIVANAPGLLTTVGIHGIDVDDQMKEPNSTLLLKRQRDFDVDGATAEWKVAEGKLIISV